MQQSKYAVGEPESVVDVAAEETMSAEMKALVDPMGSGFKWYTPPMASSNKVHESHNGRDWCISGHDMQILMMSFPQKETVTTEVGSFMFGSPDIQMDVDLTCFNGAEGVRRCCGGESCVKLLITNKASQEGYLGLTPNYPAKIIPVQFGKHINANNALFAQGGSYMMHFGDVDVDCDMNCTPKICCCAGFGACRQKIKGTDGSLVFLSAGGTVVYRKLEPGEQIIVDSRSVVAIEESVQLDIISNGRLCTYCFGGEGCFSTKLTGPGKIFMQSMSFLKFQEAVQVTTMDDRGDQAA